MLEKRMSDKRMPIVQLELIADAILDRSATNDVLATVDELFVSQSVIIAEWVEHRDARIADPESDSDEVRALIDSVDDQSREWRHLVRHGFQNTAIAFERSDAAWIAMASALYVPDLAIALFLEGEFGNWSGCK